MKKGILTAVMAAVAALFLVEVSMEALFIHRRLQQTMAPETAVQEMPQVTVVTITDAAHTPAYLLLCSREGQTLNLCALDVHTRVPAAQGSETLLQIWDGQGMRGWISCLPDTLGVKPSGYLTVTMEGIGKLVDEMGDVVLSKSDRKLLGEQAEAMLENPDSTHPELALLEAMVVRLGEMPSRQLPALAIRGMEYVKTNITLGEMLQQGASLCAGGELPCTTMVLPGSIPAVWSGSGTGRQCAYDLGQAAAQTQRFFAGK